MRRSRSWLLVAALICLAVPAPAIAAPTALVRAGHAVRSADQRFVKSARTLSRCRSARHPASRCRPADGRLQAAGRGMTRAQARLARTARRGRRVLRASSRTSAPTLTVSGQQLRWQSVGGVRSYVLRRQVAGAADLYTVVTGTSAVPPAIPGQKVTYAVRTAVSGSQWSASRSITYPKAVAGERTAAPVLTAGVGGLSWTRVADVDDYVLVAKTAGRDDAYSVVHGTSAHPDPVAGASVVYSVRTSVAGSAWAVERSVEYPAAPSADAVTAAPASDPAPPAAPSAPAPPAAKPTDAPALSADGTTLRWERVADVDRYVLVTKVPGRADAYSVVSGTSTTPPAVPGATVSYSVRTDVVGSAWALERRISYPDVPAPASPTSVATGFDPGIVAGSALNYELSFIRTLGAKHARLEFDINTPVSTMAPIIDNYAAAGIQPLLLAGFSGRSPSTSDAANLASWAAAFGPGGTFWAGKSYPASVAVRHIEFGNESNQNWQYPQISGDPNWANTSFYRDLTTQYALRFRDAARGIRAANPGVDLLAIADTPGNWPTWMNQLYATVPDFSSYVGGWIVHAYGPDPQSAVDDAMGQARSHGAPDSLPIYITELGISTDDGRCLDDNYGWSPCMTYADAGAALTRVIGGLRTRYGSRLTGVYVYAAHDLQAHGSSSGREGYFGALTLSGTAKGAYTTAVRDFLAGR